MVAKMKVIIDTDPGTDDAMAILMILKNHERIDVLAITTCHGNTNVEQASKNTVRILSAANRLDIPIFVGASNSLVNLPKVKGSNFHGMDGLGDRPDHVEPDYDKYLNREEGALHALSRIVNENKGEVVLLCLGPLTNIATAVRVDPYFGSKLKDCVIMGGNYKGQGNMTPSAEFNFYEDPEAAHIVLTQLGRDICLITLEVCCSIVLPWEWYDKVVGMETDNSRFLKQIGSVMKEKAITVGYETFVWDQVAAAVLIDEKVIKSVEHLNCQVELTGILTRGQVVVDWRKSKTGEDINVRLVKEIDVEMFKSMIEKTVSN